MDSKELEIQNYIEKIKYWVQKGGPEESEWQEINLFFDIIYANIKSIGNSSKTYKDIINAFGEAISLNTFQGHAFNQPYGYPGDFQLIEKLYNYDKNKTFSKWDTFSINHPGVKSLKNRIHYLVRLLSEKNHISPRILNLASGPCREMREYLIGTPESTAYFDCVEFDQKAIDYAISILDGQAHKVNFIHKNVLRFATEKKYDLIYSAGLFDYFDDKVFVRLLKRFSTFLKTNGEIVVGNFSPDNPSKAYMELMNWKLKYRDEKHLLCLAEDCGYDMNNVYVDSEPLGINLFLHFINR